MSLPRHQALELVRIRDGAVDRGVSRHLACWNIDPSTTWLPGVYWLIARLATRTVTSPFALSTLERYLCA